MQLELLMTKLTLKWLILIIIFPGTTSSSFAAEGMFTKIISSCTQALRGKPKVKYMQPAHIKQMFQNPADENLAELFDKDETNAHLGKGPFLTNKDLGDIGELLIDTVNVEELQIKETQPMGNILLNNQFPFYSEIKKEFHSLGVSIDMYAHQSIPFLAVDMLELIDIHQGKGSFIKDKLSPFKLSFLTGSGVPVFVRKLGSTNTAEEALQLYLKLTFLLPMSQQSTKAKGLTINEKGEFYVVEAARTNITPIGDYFGLKLDAFIMTIINFIDTGFNTEHSYMLVSSEENYLLNTLEKHNDLDDQEFAKALDTYIPKVPFYSEKVATHLSLHLHTEGFGLGAGPLKRANPSAPTGYATLLTFKMLEVLAADSNEQIKYIKSLPDGGLVDKESLIDLLKVVFGAEAQTRGPLQHLNNPEFIDFIQKQ